MTNILKASPYDLISKAADELKNQKLVQPLPWSTFVKTGAHRERLPDNPEWWYVRAAAILRSVARLGPIGTQKLRTKYGGKKMRGYQPAEFAKGSGSIIRKILQQLESANLIAQASKGVHKGRILTAKGTSFLDKIAINIAKQAQKENQ